MEKRLLTISMLVSGREETTEKSLQSLQPLRKQIGAEIILTDTGCSTEYLDKIRGLADKVLEFTWCNDFAKARNVGLREASGEWFMFIDDDEWFEDVTPIIDFFKSGEYKDYHQAVYAARNYSNFEGTDYSDEWVSRMIRLEEDTRFEGSVHEYLTPVKGNCKKLDAYVHHYGYVFATEEDRLAHFQRNIAILEKLAADEPDNFKWSLQLLKEYQSVGDFAATRRVAQAALLLLDKADSGFVNMCRGSFFLAILAADYEDISQYEREISSMQMMDKELIHTIAQPATDGDDVRLVNLRELLWKNYEKFLSDPRNPWNVRCAMATFMLLHLAEDETERLEFCADEYIHARAKYEDEMRSEQEQIIAESIVYVQDYMLRMAQIAQEVEAAMAGNGEFLNQPVRIWQLAQLGILPLEDMFLALPMSQWMVQMMVLQGQGYSDRWEEISMYLASICTRNDIRYCYFDKVTESTKMENIYIHKDNVDKMDYETMTQVITEFAQSNLNYMDCIYTEHAFEGEMELLTPEERAAVWLANGLSIGLAQWREKIQCFGNAAKAWPKMGELVKKYIALIGEAVKAQLD